MRRISDLADASREEHEILPLALSSIAARPPEVTFRPLMRGKTHYDPSVDVNALPPGAKRLRRSE